MFTNFTKSDLTYEDIIIRRNGYIGLLTSDLPGRIYCLGGGVNSLSDIRENLTHYNKEWDVIKVFRSKNSGVNGINRVLEVFQNSELVYSRPIEEQDEKIKYFEFSQDGIKEFVEKVQDGCIEELHKGGNWDKWKINIKINNFNIGIPNNADYLTMLENSLIDMAKDNEGETDFLKSNQQNIKQYEFDKENVEQFIKDVANELPDGDDEGFDDQWNKNGIQIIINDKKITVPMCCDALNELERSLKDMVNSWESGDPTEGNIVYFTEFDMLKELIKWELENNNFDNFNECVEDFKDRPITNIITNYLDYLELPENKQLKFNTIDFTEREEEFNQMIGKIREELRCTNIAEIFQSSFDITFLMDYSLKGSGELIDFYYGIPNKEDTKSYVEEYKKQKSNKSE